MNLKNAQIVNQSNNSTINLTNSQFKECSNNNLQDEGGVVYNNGGKIISSNNLYESNFVKVAGGVIYNKEGGNVSFDSDIFSRNSAIEELGGAIYSTGNLAISKTDFTENSANKGGGAIYISGVAKITESDFNKNFLTGSGIGGAIYNSSNDLVITDSNFVNNYINGSLSSGGAIFNEGTLNLIAKNNPFKIEGNEVEKGQGGAIFNKGLLTLTANDKGFEFLGNRASFGGAIYNEGTAILQNANIFNNISYSGSGGAISNVQGDMTISDSSFSTNSVMSGSK